MRTFIRLIPAVLLALIFSAASGTEFRTYTLTSGQTAKATLVGVRGNQVSLILEDGRQVTVEMSRLSQADRIYIQNNTPAGDSVMPTTTSTAPAATPSPVATSPGTLKLAWTKNRIGDKVQATDKNIVTAEKSETWKCQFELTNTSRLRLEDLKVQYNVYFRMKSRTGARSKSNHTRTVTGFLKVPALDGFRSLKVETPEMKTTGTASQVLVYDREDRKYYDSGVRELSMEEIEGVKVTVLQGSTEVLRYVSPGMRDTLGP